jgi:hypothetical protein
MYAKRAVFEPTALRDAKAFAGWHHACGKTEPAGGRQDEKDRWNYRLPLTIGGEPNDGPR